jgi:hypothetical protein
LPQTANLTARRFNGEERREQKKREKIVQGSARARRARESTRVHTLTEEEAAHPPVSSARSRGAQMVALGVAETKEEGTVTSFAINTVSQKAERHLIVWRYLRLQQKIHNFFAHGQLRYKCIIWAFE